jgi:hypothetical protein
MLYDITLYWLTNTGTSGARLYWENNANNFNAVNLLIPAAVNVVITTFYDVLLAPKVHSLKSQER